MRPTDGEMRRLSSSDSAGSGGGGAGGGGGKDPWLLSRGVRLSKEATADPLLGVDRTLSVAFLHLDLGIGGAERLVVSAATGLQERGHSVDIWTSHHDDAHCFPETRQGLAADGGTSNAPLRGHVHVRGDWLPTRILGGCTALCAVLRILYVAVVLCWTQWSRVRKERAQRTARAAHQPPPDTTPRAGDASGGGRGVAGPSRNGRAAAATSATLRTERSEGSEDGETQRWQGQGDAVDSVQRPYDVVFCDGVSICVPLLQLAAGLPVFFYCHYPDKLLCVERGPWIKRIYRWPLDWLEEVTTACADVVAVNSQFTAGVFRAAFTRAGKRTTPYVLYPPCDPDAFALRVDAPSPELGAILESLPGIETWFVSLNRFERKKRVALAVEAMAALKSECEGCRGDGDSASMFRHTGLVVAGGYDPRVTENVEHLQELRKAVAEHGLQEHVAFCTSVSDRDKLFLLQHARAVLYTPDKEHFGIVPVEAMLSGTPVMAVDSGGPTESILHKETGLLLPQEPRAFAKAMASLLKAPDAARRMGRTGRAHAIANFSLDSFAETLERYLRGAISIR